jgi:hypothetical protein
MGPCSEFGWSWGPIWVGGYKNELVCLHKNIYKQWKTFSQKHVHFTCSASVWWRILSHPGPQVCRWVRFFSSSFNDCFFYVFPLTGCFPLVQVSFLVFVFFSAHRLLFFTVYFEFFFEFFGLCCAIPPPPPSVAQQVKPSIPLGSSFLLTSHHFFFY